MAERAEECPGHLHLPWAQFRGDEARYGGRNHRRIELGDERANEFARAFVGELHDVQQEVPYVLDVERETVERREGARNYGEPSPTRIGVTIDIEGVDSTGMCIVGDWKSRKRVTIAETNLQLAIAALVKLTLGATRVRGVFVYLDNGYRDKHVFTAFDRASIWDRLRRLATRAQSDRTLTMGQWCEYCPALASCPSQRALISTLTNSDVDALVSEMPPEQVGLLWIKKKAFDKLGKQIDAAIRARVMTDDGVPTPTGKVLRLVECERTSTDYEAMRARLVELGEDPEKFTRKTIFDQLRETKGDR
jgi:hypothetical protein